MLKSNSTYKYLDFVKFSQLYNWSVQYLNESKIRFTTKYPLVQIKEFLTRNKTAIEIQDDVYYKRATIKVRNGGIFLRDTVLGNKIGTKNQFRISKGQFLLSKIDARNGAFGVVPEELDGGVITGNFWTFDVDYSKVNPHYLALLTTTNEFIGFCEQASNGTTNRHYLQEPLFLNIKVPLPSLAEQNKLVEEYNTYIDLSDSYKKECQKIDNDIIQYFNKSIGLKKIVNKTQLLSFIRLKDISTRWDSFAITNLITAKVPIYPFSKFINNIATGTTPPTSQKGYFNGDIKFYTPADINGEKYLTTSERTLTQKAIIDKKARSFHKGDILFVGIGSTVGKVGIVSDNIVTTNQQITGITLNNSILSPEYAFYYLHYHREITTADHSKTTLPIVNQEKIANIPIPTPDISQQKDIVEQIDIMRDKIIKINQKAVEYRTKALKNFRTKIFE